MDVNMDTSVVSTPPYTILIDTREQSPWTFEGAQTMRSALPAGDYSIDGLTDAIAIERKSLQDWVNTIIHNRERFHKECVKLANMPHVCIIIESALSDVKLHHYKSRAKPGSVLAIGEGIEKKFRIPVIWGGNRYGAIVKARQWLDKGWVTYGA